MLQHIPHGDDIEGVLRQIGILESTIKDVRKDKRLAGIPNSGWRNLTTIRLPLRIGLHSLQKESEATPHVQESSGTPGKKSPEEVLMHSVAGFVPIEVFIFCNFSSPKSVIVRVGRKRREDMLALPAFENVYV
jgi:hypothetical protein